MLSKKTFYNKLTCSDKTFPGKGFLASASCLQAENMRGKQWLWVRVHRGLCKKINGIFKGQGFYYRAVKSLR